MASNDVESVSRSRQPKVSPFYQQKLSAWHPMFSVRRSAIMFSVFGVSFIIIGAAVLSVSNNLTEVSYDYTGCKDSISKQPCSELAVNGKTCKCTYSFDLTSSVQVRSVSLIPDFLKGPFFVYYGLKNFYQNHRRYTQSRSDNQLLGRVVSPDSLSSCAPYSTQVINNQTVAILPCGAVANSLFNDTFVIKYSQNGNQDVTVPLSMNNIAWQSDIDRKFGKLTPETLKDTVKPPSWPETIDQRSASPFQTDEDLIVWMRVAALPNFRKLYRRVVHEGNLKDGLPAGKYTVDIKYAYPVISFNGHKLFILGNTSVLGGKNPALGILFLITGCLHLAFGILFTVIHCCSPTASLCGDEEIHKSEVLYDAYGKTFKLRRNRNINEEL